MLIKTIKELEKRLKLGSYHEAVKSKNQLSMSYNEMIKSRGNSKNTNKKDKGQNYDEISDDFFNKIRNERKANPKEVESQPQNANNLTNKSMSLDLEQNNEKLNMPNMEENDMQINISDIVSGDREKG